MTMHLEGPWLSSTGKKKGKTKFASAAAKANAAKLEAEWQALRKKWGADTVTKSRAAPTLLRDSAYNLAIPESRRTTAHIPSRTTPGGSTALRAAQVYTGTKVKGIATMHKSNAVPVFSDQEAVDISSMRR